MQIESGALPNYLAVGVGIAWILIIIVGVVKGRSGTITVFRNYDDLALAFLTVLVPVLGGFLAFLAGNKDGPLMLAIGFVVVCEVLLLWSILRRTWYDNPSAGAFLLAAVTKTTLSFLFVQSVMNVIAPSGKTSAARSASRRAGFFWLLFLAPLVYSLVRDQEGFLSPRKT